MSSNRKPHINFVKKVGEKPQRIDAATFFQGTQKSWTDQIIMSEDDLKKCNKDASMIKRTPVSPPSFYQEIWGNIVTSNNDMSDQVAIYDTESEAGLGLIATHDINRFQHLIYAGQWQFQQFEYKHDVSDMTAVYWKGDKDIIYGYINATTVRNYAVYANTAPQNKEELEHYAFQNDTIKASVATANLSPYLIARPDDCKIGPPFVCVLIANRDIKKGEPLLQHYGQSYFLDMENEIDECFFDKTGLAIDKKYYQTRSLINFRIYIDDIQNFVDTNYNKSKLFWGLDESYATEFGKITLSHKDIQEAINKYPRRRYISFAKPSTLHLLHSKEKILADREKSLEIKTAQEPHRNTLFADKSDPGKYLRNLIYSDSHTAAQCEHFILQQKSKMSDHEFLSMINSSGADSGLTGLHRAAEKLKEDKITLLLRYGANPSLKTAKDQKTPFDIAKSKNGSEAILALLKTPTATSDNNLKSTRPPLSLTKMPL